MDAVFSVAKSTSAPAFQVWIPVYFFKVIFSANRTPINVTTSCWIFNAREMLCPYSIPLLSGVQKSHRPTGAITEPTPAVMTYL